MLETRYNTSSYLPLKETFMLIHKMQTSLEKKHKGTFPLSVILFLFTQFVTAISRIAL